MLLIIAAPINNDDNNKMNNYSDECKMATTDRETETPAE